MRLKRAFSFASRITERKSELKEGPSEGLNMPRPLSIVPSTSSSTAASCTLSSASSIVSVNTPLPSYPTIVLPNSVASITTSSGPLTITRRRSAYELPFLADIRRLLPDRTTITEDAAIAIWCFGKDMVELLIDYCEGTRRLIEGRRLEEALRELMLPEDTETTTRPRWTSPFCIKGKTAQYPPLLRALLHSVTGVRLHAAYQLGIDYMSIGSGWTGHSNRLTNDLTKTLSDQIIRHVAKSSAELVIQSDRTCVGVNEVLLTLSTDPQLCRAFAMMDLSQQLTEIVSTTICRASSLHAIHHRTISRQTSKFSLGSSSVASSKAQDLRAFMADPTAAFLGVHDDARDSQWTQVFRGLGSSQ
ncbi:hypothetical protein BDF19DRAFT_419196 [Syncephalis fuscata]|nr:hypothetical protein BDF19DRAFT_419196 [Syncephalis fuscata]